MSLIYYAQYYAVLSTLVSICWPYFALTIL